MQRKNDYLFFCGRNNKQLGLRVLSSLSNLLGRPEGRGLEFSFIDFGLWGDGCPNDKIIDWTEIKGKNIVLFDSLSTRESMLEFIQLVMAFRRQYGAASLLAVIPFLLVRRCDHEEKAEEIAYLKHYIEILAFAGVTDMIVCSPHSDSIATNCEKVGIKFEAAYMDFSQTLKTLVPKGEKIIVYSPDEGSIPRAIAHAKKIPGSRVMFNFKVRKKNRRTEIRQPSKQEIEAVIKKYSEEFEFDIYYINEEEIRGANVIMIDDEMSSGGTASSTGRSLKEMGAKAIFFAFTHPVCSSGEWKENIIYQQIFKKILAGDTIIRNEYNRTGGKIIDISTTEVISSAMYRLTHHDMES